MHTLLGKETLSSAFYICYVTLHSTSRVPRTIGRDTVRRREQAKGQKGGRGKDWSRVRKEKEEKERKKNEDNKRNSKIGKRLAEQALGVSLETWQYGARRETHQARGYSLGIVIRSLSRVRRFVERNDVTHTHTHTHTHIQRDRETDMSENREKAKCAGHNAEICF